MRLRPNFPLKLGTPLTVTHPIGEMEKDMINKHGITAVSFEGYTEPHGFAHVRDDQGAIWHVHPEALTFTPKTRAVSLECSCCGNGARGRQWYNRDTGYGMCKRCADENTAKYGEGGPGSDPCDNSTYSMAGLRGYHFDIEDD